MNPQNAIDTGTANLPGDHHLIEESRRDGERFAAIFDRHAVAIHRYLSRRLGGSLADDLTAETFLVAFRQRERYDVRFPDARPWLYGIATNLLRHERRAEIRQYRALARTGIDPATVTDEDAVVARVAAGAEQRRLAGVLAGLPAGERSVLLLIAWEQFSYEEVARTLDIPVGTVRSRLHSARKRIRAILPDLDPGTSKELS